MFDCIILYSTVSDKLCINPSKKIYDYDKWTWQKWLLRDNCWLLIIKSVKEHTQDLKIESADDGLKLAPKMAKMEAASLLNYVS